MVGGSLRRSRPSAGRPNSVAAAALDSHHWRPLRSTRFTGSGSADRFVRQALCTERDTPDDTPRGARRGRFPTEIGRASCRERVEGGGGSGGQKKSKRKKVTRAGTDGGAL